MKKYLILFLLFAGLMSSAQTPGKYKRDYGYGVNIDRMNIMKALHIPLFSITTGIWDDADAPLQKGAIILNTDDNKFYYYNGSAWVLGSGITTETQTLQDVTALGNATMYDLLVRPGLGKGTDVSGGSITFEQTSGSRTGQIGFTPLTANRIWTLPDKTGTFAMTSDITGTLSGLTTNYIPVATGASSLGNSVMFQYAGTRIGIGTTTPGTTFHTANSGNSTIMEFSNSIGDGLLGNDANGIYAQSQTSGKGIWMYNTAGNMFGMSGSNGNFGVGTTTPNAYAAMEVYSTSKGFLTPRLTDAQLAGIGIPPTGLLAYNTDHDKFVCYNSAGWNNFVFEGSDYYIKNQTSLQSSSNFNISGIGSFGTSVNITGAAAAGFPLSVKDQTGYGVFRVVSAASGTSSVQVGDFTGGGAASKLILLRPASSGIGTAFTFSGVRMSIDNGLQGGGIDFTGGLAVHTSGTDNHMVWTSSFAPTSGTGIYSQQRFAPTINQTGGASGISRGIFIDPTITAAADFRALEISNNSGKGIYQTGSSATNTFAGATVFSNRLTGNLSGYLDNSGFGQQGLFSLQLIAPTSNGLAIEIGGMTGNTSANGALVDFRSTTKGILLPRLTTTQMNAVTTPAAGVQIYNTTENANYVYNGSAWMAQMNAGTQTFVGSKIFSSDLNINSIRVGLGNSSIATNTAVGLSALNSITTGDYETAVGQYALLSTTTGYRNTAIGAYALYANTTGGQNVALGYLAAGAQTTASNNFALGYQTLASNVLGMSNLAIGSQAMQNYAGLNRDEYNVAIGTQAMFNGTSAYSNTAIGGQSLYNNTSGSYNIAVGVASGGGNTDGSKSVMLGGYAARANTHANNIVSIGYNGGGDVSSFTGTGYTTVGYQAGLNMISGSDYGTFLGYQSGYNNTTGAKNIHIGAVTTTSNANITTGSNNTTIGNDIQQASATASNQLNIMGLIFATGANATGSSSAGSLGIGTNAPGYKLEVNGTTGLNDAVTLGSTITLKAYTVATLPAAGTAGRLAYVTDALAPSYLVTVVGGGTVVTSVFDNGTNWVAQ